MLVCFLPWLIYLRLEIDIEGQLKTKHYDKRDYLNFSMMNFPFTCSNISATYVIYASQLIRYSRACGPYQDVLVRGLQQTRKILNQWLPAVKWKSSQDLLLPLVEQELVHHRFYCAGSCCSIFSFLCSRYCFGDHCFSFCSFCFGHQQALADSNAPQTTLLCS